jgi:hypothetical protein
MVRGKTLSAIVLLGVLASCDENSTAPSSYPTFTCLGIGPAESEKFKAVTGHLKLF